MDLAFNLLFKRRTLSYKMNIYTNLQDAASKTSAISLESEEVPDPK